MASPLAGAPAIQHLHFIDDDFSGVTVLAGLVLPLAGLQAPLHVDFHALLQVLAGNLPQAIVAAIAEHHPVPLGFLLHLAGLPVLPALAGGDTGIGHRAAVRKKSGLGIIAQIAHQDDLVHAP